ncbi:hypothetical protein SGPA1_21857 [Streptomyces misionensis JCM 4497]
MNVRSLSRVLHHSIAAKRRIEVWRYGRPMYRYVAPHPPPSELGSFDTGSSDLIAESFMIVGELLALRPSSCRRRLPATANARTPSESHDRDAGEEG